VPSLDFRAMRPSPRPGDIEIRCDGCLLRALTLSDASAIARHANDREVWLNLRDVFPHPYSTADAESYINYASSRPIQTSFGIVVEDEAIGNVSLKPGEDIERVSAEIGYFIGRAFWNRGIMTEVVRAVTRYGFESLNLHRIFAVPFAHNEASSRVLEKAGYVREGYMRRSAIKDGRVLDQLLYAAHDDVWERDADR
jgi:[ribosomal protein S5]-alanine N-acetyltransferase